MVYVVEYDIPTKNPTKRVDFYRKVHRMLKQHYGKDVKFSSYTRYLTEDEAMAKKFMELTAQYSKRCNLYKAVKMQ